MSFEKRKGFQGMKSLQRMSLYGLLCEREKHTLETSPSAQRCIWCLYNMGTVHESF